jgi:hypothetical protein
MRANPCNNSVASGGTAQVHNFMPSENEPAADAHSCGCVVINMPVVYVEDHVSFYADNQRNPFRLPATQTQPAYHQLLIYGRDR